MTSHSAGVVSAANDRRNTMLTDNERETLTRLFGWVPEPEPLEHMLDAVEAILAAREGEWRAPIEALAAKWEAEARVLEANLASESTAVYASRVALATRASQTRSLTLDLRAALESVSAPGNEAGQ